MKSISQIVVVFILFVCTSVILGEFAQAAGPIVRSGEEIIVETQKVLEGDFYALGSTVSISGEAKYDVYVSGGTVMVNAPIQGDFGVIGGTVQVHGAVADDVRVVGGDVTIAGPVEGDLVVAAGKVHILSTAQIKGDVLFVAGDIQIDGPVEGSLYGTAGAIRINTHIGGDISLRFTEGFSLGDMANITGSITYKGYTELVRAQGAVVEGEIYKEMISLPSGTDVAKDTVLKVLMVLFAALSLFLILRNRMIEYVTLLHLSYGRQGLIGFALFLGIPFMGMLLTASVVGVFLGVILLTAYVALIFISMVATCITLGSIVDAYVFKSAIVQPRTAVLGAIILGILAYIPVLGVLLIMVTFFMTLGSLSTVIYRNFK